MRFRLLVSTVSVSLVLVLGPSNAQLVEFSEEVRSWDGDPETGAPATWSVCSSDCDFTTIQAAVDYADFGDTIELGAETFAENVTVGKDLNIRGVSAGLTVVDGSAGAHVFLHVAHYLTLSEMTIRNADVGIESRGHGVTVENCVVRDNTTGVSTIAWEPYVVPEVLILSTTITGPQSPGLQPCVRNTGAHLTIARSTISGCDTGVYTTGWSVCDGCSGGGSYEELYLIGETEITNSTVTGTGRGVDAECVRIGFCTGYCCDPCHGVRVSIEYSTITDSSDDGLSVKSCFACGLYCVSSMAIEGSIVNNSGGSDCWASVLDEGFNISSDGTCPGSTQADPHLLPLADNGGPTLTHALAPDSPAIDAGALSCEPTDQRGVARPHDGDDDGIAECDIGAFEYAAPEDADQDGVLDDVDYCPGTVIPESVPTHHLGVNRWALVDEDGVFDTTAPPGGGGGPDFEFTIDDTRGCSCEQIIEAMALGWGHTKFGCSTGALRQWNARVWGYELLPHVEIEVQVDSGGMANFNDGARESSSSGTNRTGGSGAQPRELPTRRPAPLREDSED